MHQLGVYRYSTKWIVSGAKGHWNIYCTIIVLPMEVAKIMSKSLQKSNSSQRWHYFIQFSHSTVSYDRRGMKSRSSQGCFVIGFRKWRLFTAIKRIRNKGLCRFTLDLRPKTPVMHKKLTAFLLISHDLLSFELWRSCTSKKPIMIFQFPYQDWIIF